MIDISLTTPALRSKLPTRLIGAVADVFDLLRRELRSDCPEADFRLSSHAHKNSSRSMVKSTIQSRDSLSTRLAWISTSDSPGWVGVSFSLTGSDSEANSPSEPASHQFSVNIPNARGASSVCCSAVWSWSIGFEESVSWTCSSFGCCTPAICHISIFSSLKSVTTLYGSDVMLAFQMSLAGPNWHGLSDGH